MIITCPHCQTHYQVTYEAIGATGRKVSCATCHKDWRAQAHEPAEHHVDLDPVGEDGLDDAMAAEERAATAERGEGHADLLLERGNDQGHETTGPTPAQAAPPPDLARMRRLQREFDHRRKLLRRDLPYARMRRVARWLVWLGLVAMLFGAITGRAAIVEQLPALAGVYEAVGLGVNVVGLDFAEVETLRAARDGQDMLSVKADIVTVTRRLVTVPPVVVTLLDEAGRTLYQWSVTPPVGTLMAGEHTAIETQLAAPPAAAKSVRLSFSGSRSAEGAPSTAVVSQGDHQ